MHPILPLMPIRRSYPYEVSIMESQSCIENKESVNDEQIVVCCFSRFNDDDF